MKAESDGEVKPQAKGKPYPGLGRNGSAALRCREGRAGPAARRLEYRAPSCAIRRAEGWRLRWGLRLRVTDGTHRNG